MSSPEKLPTSDSKVEPSFNGATTPSDFSVMEEKEQAMADEDVQSRKSLDNSLQRVESSPYPSSRKLVGILVGVALSIFLVSLDMTIVATAIPRITDQFQSLEDVGWYGSGFFLTFASFQSMWGKAYKYFDLKWVYMLCIAIFEIGSLICAVAPNSTTLIVGRAIAGAGGAGIASGSYTILAFSAPPKQVAAYTGILGAVYAIASVIGKWYSADMITTHTDD
jgi:hypothetical protein